MFKNPVIFVLLSGLLLLPLASNSEAVLWDLVIDAHVKNTPIISGERPIVTGVITDHASNPVHKATVNIKSGSMSIFTTTSETGEFQAELGKHDRIPGNYMVNISATTLEGQNGIASIQFQVRGELTQTTINEQKLSTTEAQKYLNAEQEDFKNNPIGFMLYNYYQKLYQEYLEDEKVTEKLNQEQAYINQQKEIANELRIEAIEEYQPSMGIYSGPQYENYVNSLDEDLRDTVIEHLNFTKNMVEEAQIVRNEILENGGTIEEAQKAYLAQITTSREMIENFDKSKLLETENSEEVDIANLELPTTETKKEADNETLVKSPITVNANGINVEVDFSESVFFVNVNGTMMKFLLNGTEISLLNND